MAIIIIIIEFVITVNGGKRQKNKTKTERSGRNTQYVRELVAADAAQLSSNVIALSPYRA